MMEEVFARLDCIFGDSNGHSAAISYVKKNCSYPNVVESIRHWLYERSSFSHEAIDIWVEVQRERIVNEFGSYYRK